MKTKDFFKKLKEQGKINNAEFDAFIESIPDFEMPDTVVPVFEDSFFTKDRALSHKDISGPLWSKALDPIDNDIKEILKFLPAETVIDIEKQDSTYKKMAAVKSGIQTAIQKAGKNPVDEDVKKKLHEKESVIQDLMGKIEKINTDYANKEKTIASEWEGKFKNYRLDSELEKLANSFTFADAYKDSRPALTKALLGEIKAKNKLDLVEKDGGFDLVVLDEQTGAPRFNGNSPVTISSLLEEPFKAFLKVNNNDTQQNGKTNQATQSYKVDTQNPSIRRGANTSVEM